jgi:hypothetical protein
MALNISESFLKIFYGICPKNPGTNAPLTRKKLPDKMPDP